jgi:flagellar motility protein MotE (MotC chaperone)
MAAFKPKRGRFARLLPSVVALGAVVLVLKTTDLVHEAYAQVSGQVAALTNDPVPANKDFAGGEDDQVASASEVDVVNSLSRRRRELDVQGAQLNNQANMIAAAEQRVDAKISQLKQLQAQINALLVQRDKLQQDQIDSLVKTYSTMKAKDAARIFNTLPDDVLVPVAQKMKSDILAQVLANMNSDNAKTLTIKLANKLTLPQTADAMAPVPAPAPVAPVQAAAAPPVQVASIPTTAPATAAQPAAAPAAPAAKPRRRRPAAPTADQAAATTPAKAPEAVPTATAASATLTATPTATPAAAAAPYSSAKPKG